MSSPASSPSFSPRTPPKAISNPSSKASSTASSSIISDSSTVVYDHEAFETFQFRVRELCRRIWPMALHEQTTVERLQGGSYNRVIGLSIVQYKNEEGAAETVVSHFILRIPRYDDSAVDSDVSILNLASRYAGIRVAPQVVMFDPSPNNPLESPYTIQKRIPGERLHEVYPSLSHEQQCAIAKQLGQFFKSLLSCKSHTAGGLVPVDDNSTDCSSLSEAFPGIMAAIRPFGHLNVMGSGSYGESSRDLKYPRDPKGLNWPDTLLAAFEHRLNIEKSKPEYDFIEGMYMEAFIQATKSMESFFMFYPNHHCLCHLDVAPRNILVDLNTEAGPTITGILDWDEAVFAPSFVACAPPMWLWAWSDEDDEEEDERRVNDLLPTDNQHEVKRYFDEAAGSEYSQYAYSPQFRLARKLCRFSMRRICTNEMVHEADEFFDEVTEMQKDAESGLTPVPLDHPGIPKIVKS